jgi:hypothetical protein
MAKKTATLKREWVKLLVATTKVADHAQNLLVEFGYHYIQHGDTSLLGWAVETSWSTGFKRQAMMTWVKKHLKVSMTEAGGGKVICEVNNRNRDIIDMAVAAGDLFYLNMDKAEKKETPFDLPKLAKTVAKRAIDNEVSLADLQAAIMAAYKAQAGVAC